MGLRCRKAQLMNLTFSSSTGTLLACPASAKVLQLAKQPLFPLTTSPVDLSNRKGSLQSNMFAAFRECSLGSGTLAGILWR